MLGRADAGVTGGAPPRWPVLVFATLNTLWDPTY